MTTLIAANERVQAVMIRYPKSTSAQKQNRITQLEQTLHQQGKYLTEVFPNKQMSVVNYIIHLTVSSGIWKVGAQCIADSCDCGVRTVYSVINKLKKMPEFIIGRLKQRTGGQGKYIFVDTKHADFQSIMQEVFSLDSPHVAEPVAQPIAEPFTEIDPLNANGSKDSSGVASTSTYISSLGFKTCSLSINNSIVNQEDVETIQQSIYAEDLPLDEQQIRMHTYATNEYQHELFNFMKDMRLHEQLAPQLYKIALAVGSTATKQDFIYAKDAAVSLNNRLFTRSLHVDHSIRAYFDTIYQEARSQGFAMQKSVVEDVPFQSDILAPIRSKKVAFYNWLEERE